MKELGAGGARDLIRPVLDGHGVVRPCPEREGYIGLPSRVFAVPRAEMRPVRKLVPRNSRRHQWSLLSEATGNRPHLSLRHGAESVSHRRPMAGGSGDASGLGV